MADKTLTITIENFDRVLAALKAFPERTSRAIHDALVKSANVVEAQGKIALTEGPTRAIKTGRLRASTAVQKISAFQAEIYPTVNYAIYVHEGTRYMQARPFMEVAKNASLPTVQAIFDDTIAQVINNL